MKVFYFNWKSGSSNTLVEGIYSIVTLRKFVLTSVSNKLLPKRRVLIKAGLQRSSKLLSMFSMVLRRVRLLSYIEHLHKSLRLLDVLQFLNLPLYLVFL